MKLYLVGVMMAAVLAGAEMDVYVGTRNREGKSKGIYKMTFDPANGVLTPAKLVAETPDPTFLAVHPTRALLFSTNAVPEGTVSAFAIEPGGGLRFLNKVSSKGAGPAHVQIDRTGQWVTSANFVGGGMAVYRIEADGRLSEAVDWRQHVGKSVIPGRQDGPHAHSTYFSPDNKVLYVADLGLDLVKRYGFDAATGKLTDLEPWEGVKGGGPRHMAFGKKRAYLLNEMGSSVSVFAGGKLVETVSALPVGFSGTSTAAEVLLDSREKFLYSSNRGANTIAIFRVGAKLVKVADVAVGKVPRGFVFSPDGKFMLIGAQDEDYVQVYRVDAKTGALEKVGGQVAAFYPICLRFERRKGG
jgi:6-phosphogluconolactonase